jgi:hypothetical protein
LKRQLPATFNALSALIGDMIYKPSDFYFRCPLRLKRRLAG